MKKLPVLVGLLLCAASSTNAYQGLSSPYGSSYDSGESAYSKSSSYDNAPNRVWEIAPEIYHATYKEQDIMKNKGMMVGIGGAYTYDRETWLLKGELRGAWGSVDYSSPSSGTASGFGDTMFEARGTMGFKQETKKNHIITFFGVAYRYLNDDSSGKTTSTGARGYERESNYFYSPIGIEFTRHLKDRWTWGGSIEYDLFWTGRQVSHLSDAVSSLGNVSNDQDSGYGFRFSLKFKRQGDKFDVLIEPFFRWWHVDYSGLSNVTYQGVLVGYGYEPENTTSELGAKIALLY